MMDKETKAKLEDVHKRTPRYLFRLWSDGEDGNAPSGGRSDLNTTTAITPLAFANGGGHTSAYHMTTDEFLDMTGQHLCTSVDVVTEFSSWSGSLTYILNKCPGLGPDLGYKNMDENHLYVAVLDVEMLSKANQAFYVPLLSSLRSKYDCMYPREYLVHGVVKGPWYKAIRFSALRATCDLKALVDFTWIFTRDLTVHAISKQQVATARRAGELFGDRFAFAITIMLLCCKKRERELWQNRVDSRSLEIIIEGIQGLKPPEGWGKPGQFLSLPIDTTHNFSDTLQRQKLVLTLYRRLGAYKLALMYEPTNKGSNSVQKPGKSTTEEHRPIEPSMNRVNHAKSTSSKGAMIGKKHTSGSSALWRPPAREHLPKKTRRSDVSGQAVTEVERALYGLDISQSKSAARDWDITPMVGRDRHEVRWLKRFEGIVQDRKSKSGFAKEAAGWRPNRSRREEVWSKSEDW